MGWRSGCPNALHLHATEEIPAHDPAVPFWGLSHNHSSIHLMVGYDEFSVLVFWDVGPGGEAKAMSPAI